jgi:hypothetical protein
MEMHTCVVVAQNQANREFLGSLLKASGLDAVLLASLGELSVTLGTVAVCGILVELASVVTASTNDKKVNLELLEYYPCAKFRFDHGQILMVGETFEQFVGRCLQFQPRTRRLSERKTLHFAVFLSADESFAHAEKSVTVNLSDKGVFVYSALEWEVGKRVWLKFPGDTRAIRGTVRSYQPWGCSKSFPGIGIEIDAGQEELSAPANPSTNDQSKNHFS